MKSNFYSLDRNLTFMSLNVEILVYCWVFRILFSLKSTNLYIKSLFYISCTQIWYVWMSILWNPNTFICFKHLNKFSDMFNMPKKKNNNNKDFSLF